jgi:hypothetical protein
VSISRRPRRTVHSSCKYRIIRPNILTKAIGARIVPRSHKKGRYGPGEARRGEPYKSRSACTLAGPEEVGSRGRPKRRRRDLALQTRLIRADVAVLGEL